MIINLTFDVPNSYELAPKSFDEIRNAIRRTFEVLDEIGCRQATWFIDEYGYKISERDPALLTEISDYGEIGIHSHMNYPPWGKRNRLPRNKDIMLRQIKEARERLQLWASSQGLGQKQEICSIRSGNLLTTDDYFRALSEAGMLIDSSFAAYRTRYTRRPIQLVTNLLYKFTFGYRFTDIRPVKPGTQPFFFEIRSEDKKSKFRCLEFPIHIFTLDFQRGLDLERMFFDQLESAREINKNPIITICSHPYEFSHKETAADFAHEFIRLFKEIKENCLFHTLSQTRDRLAI